jgi:hypothetical protein
MRKLNHFQNTCAGSKIYKTDTSFKIEVDQLSRKYGDKLSQKYNPEKDENLDRACFEAAKEYLLEESSIIFKLIELEFKAQFYPGNRNAAMRYIYNKHFGKDVLPWIRYDIIYPCSSTANVLTPTDQTVPAGSVIRKNSESHEIGLATFGSPPNEQYFFNSVDSSQTRNNQKTDLLAIRFSN